jgi:DNA-directed RNA polymerase subunit RPC12/RpoP
MLKAYDTFLLSEVSADLAAKAGGFEPYRYKCAHCGKEVRLAAIDSISVIPHFRHLIGNSGVECEIYLGQCGFLNTDAHSRKSKNERAEFYFDNNTKMFYLGLIFSDDEISAYEKLSAIFELRAVSQESPFQSLRINSKNFTPDIQRMIPLEKFSYSFFLSNTLNGVKREYTIFNNNGNVIPTFFKMQLGDGGHKAKLVRSSVLYTNIPYIAVYQSPIRYGSPANISLPKEIMVENTFKFETMDRNFLGKVLTINSKTADINSLLSSWGYQLEAAETLTLLWPPATLDDDKTLINTNSAYLYSTFELQAHGNINLHSEDIKRIDNRLSKVAICSKTKIYKKNSELMLETCEQEAEPYIDIPITRTVDKIYSVSDGNTYLFNLSGVSPLSKGMRVQMTPASEVKHYTSGYLDKIVTLPEQTMPDVEIVLQDVLMHYKITEPFNWDDYESFDLSHPVFQYIESCEKSGQINSAVKRLIKERRI